MKREQLDDFVYDDDGKASRVKRWRETLPNGVAHETIDLTDSGPLDDTAIFAAPAGSLFVLGDNRDNAQDSPYPCRASSVASSRLRKAAVEP